MRTPGPFVLGGRARISDLVRVAEGGGRVRFTAAAAARMARARRALLRAAAGSDPIYGVNTGFGELALKRIPPGSIKTLQRNLVLSHACGVGEPLSEAEARGILFLRANELARGHSGCRPELVGLMAAMLNRGVTPVVPCRGSVGASGDLAPQAHSALVLIGEGRAAFRGRTLPGRKALAAAGLKPLDLEAKEGLSLINGTQAMQSVGGLALRRAERVMDAAVLAGTMGLEAIKGTPAPFDARISRLKPHPGQIRTAAALRSLMRGSEIRDSHAVGDERVQDPYSFRCMPQVHGAALDALGYTVGAVETEMASVTDNPIVDGNAVLSGGNFHGAAIALAFDFCSAALAALGGISERRIFQVVSGMGPGLPPFLAADPGLESGFMIAQVAAAALASENKTLAHPASADSIPTSANKEDFVSMGMWAALKFKSIVENAAQIVGIELLAAAQGVEFQRPLKPGKGVAEGLRRLRRRAGRTLRDEPLHGKMAAARDMVLEGAFGCLP